MLRKFDSRYKIHPMESSRNPSGRRRLLLMNKIVSAKVELKSPIQTQKIKCTI